MSIEKKWKRLKMLSLKVPRNYYVAIYGSSSTWMWNYQEARPVKILLSIPTLYQHSQIVSSVYSLAHGLHKYLN